MTKKALESQFVSGWHTYIPKTNHKKKRREQNSTQKIKPSIFVAAIDSFADTMDIFSGEMESNIWVVHQIRDLKD